MALIQVLEKPVLDLEELPDQMEVSEPWHQPRLTRQVLEHLVPEAVQVRSGFQTPSDAAPPVGPPAQYMLVEATDPWLNEARYKSVKSKQIEKNQPRPGQRKFRSLIFDNIQSCSKSQSRNR